VIGKALFSIPLVGYLPLHIIEVTIIIVGIMILYEVYQRSRRIKRITNKEKQKKAALGPIWIHAISFNPSWDAGRN